MSRLLLILALILLTRVADAKGGGFGGYYITITPAAQPGNECIPEGVPGGQETKLADGTNILVQGVHGVQTARCRNPAFPILATVGKLASDQVRNVPTIQCVAPGIQPGQEVALPNYGLATVLDVHGSTDQCLGPGHGLVQAATVISTAAYRAQKATQAPEQVNPATRAPAASRREPTEADVRREYERLVAVAPAVEEYHVRHILVSEREEAQAAIDRIRAGESFAALAARLSRDPASGVKGGDLGWNTPDSFDPQFSKGMIALKPFGVSTEPTRTRFGWHVIEVLRVKMGKDSFPDFAAVKDRIAAKLDREWKLPLERAPAAAVCRKMVPVEPPAEATQQRASGTVLAEIRIERGRAEVVSLTGPAVFHSAVKAAVLKYECDVVDRPVLGTQSFTFN